MTKDEEIALLRRDLADLRDRVARLEAERALFPLRPIGAPPTIAPQLPSIPLPLQPYVPAPNTTCGTSIGISGGCGE